MARCSILRVAGALAAVAGGELVLAPAASAFGGKGAVPFALFGIPSLHSIMQAIANGFFSALASALVPSWLRHGTVATIQHLVALPDPGTWPHVARLQSDSTFLGATLLPVTLAIGAVRYWAVGLTGAAHPATAITRSVTVTGVLVIYRWGIEEAVAATNTLTHGILELPAVGAGLQRIISVLFGGALLSGGGGVFGALLVIVGVVFAAGLFAAQVLLTVVLAVLIVAGPPLIAISAIPELSHLARSWGYAILAVSLVPVGWTVLFATAGALCLDATSFTGASGGLPGHVAAAFAGLITFVIAVRVPLMAVGQLRHLFHVPTGAGHGAGATASPTPGVERVRAAHARLRAVGLHGVPSVGRSVGRAAGALGAPAGGLVGATRRRVATTRQRAGSANGGPRAAAAPGKRRADAPSRIATARRILADAPRDAAAAVAASSRRSRISNVAARDAGATASSSAPGPGPSYPRAATSTNPGVVTASRTRRSPTGAVSRAPQRPRPAGAAAAPRASKPQRPARPRPPDSPHTAVPQTRAGSEEKSGGPPRPTRHAAPRRNASRSEPPTAAETSPPAKAVPRPTQPRPKGQRKGRT